MYRVKYSIIYIINTLYVCQLLHNLNEFAVHDQATKNSSCILHSTYLCRVRSINKLPIKNLPLHLPINRFLFAKLTCGVCTHTHTHTLTRRHKQEPLIKVGHRADVKSCRLCTDALRFIEYMQM